MDANTIGAFRLINLCLPEMIRKGGGHVVATGSIAGMESYEGGSVYCASKHALNSLTESFRMEVSAACPDIVFSTVSPGLVFTEFGNNALHGGCDSRALRGKAVGQDEDEVARVIIGVIRTQVREVFTSDMHKKEVMDYLDVLITERPTGL